MIDAAGAIYVIGGVDGATHYNDVWASTDGGARAGLGQRGVEGYTKGIGVLAGYMGGPGGVVEYSRGTLVIPLGHPRGTRGLPTGTLGTHG